MIWDKALAPVHAWHIQIEQDDIGLQPTDHFDARESVCGFADDFKTVLARQKGFDAAAEEGVVVYQDDFDGHGRLSLGAPVNETVVPVVLGNGFLKRHGCVWHAPA